MHPNMLSLALSSTPCDGDNNIVCRREQRFDVLYNTLATELFEEQLSSPEKKGVWLEAIFFPLQKILDMCYKNTVRGIAQSGSASALGAESRRFESCCPDHFY